MKLVIDVERPLGTTCTGCPMGVILPPAMAQKLYPKRWWVYGCNYLHKVLKSGGAFDHFAIRDKECPFDNQWGDK